MKKTLGVISLAVLLSVQILTPVTYAVWDDDFVSETYVEESVSEEVVEATDDTDEVSDEVSEEDDASEEVTEEDSSDEESQVEDTLDWDEDSEDTEESDALEEVSDPEWEEVSAWSSEESISEESPVLSEEDEAFIAKISKQWSVAKIAEELWINWYTDSSEIAVLAWIEWDYYGTKEQNNIIREYLISHAFELLKKNVSSEDVVGESVEETISSEVELTWLNEKEISWKKYYNGVTVNVLAPAKSFPEGTTLSITPIKKKNELKEIKEQLVESQEEVTEDSTVVAFDISFLYSWEEVQPVTGQTVQVTFNYENHEKLSDAEQDEEKELKVYHLNDKNEEGNKIEDISEVKVEEVEIVKNEEWELVVDAESFSIYTIVTQVHDEWPTDDQLANFEYWEISIARPDSLDASEYPKEWFTIMDRNLWASEIWVWADALTGSYGYYYQWWNNYWFSPYKNISTSLGAINVPNNEYSWSTFITPEEAYAPWMNPINTNLWQGQSRWPCPAWWHVPTASEWSDLGMYYARYYEEEDEWEVSMNCNWNGYTCFNGEWPFNWFINQFKIPFAWGLNSYASPWGPKTYVQLRSSSLDEDYPEQVYLFYAQGENIVFSQRDDNGWYGFPVRCFKDTYSWTWDVHTITFVFNGWSWSTAAINVLSWEKAIEPSEPVKEGYVFDGWYSWDNVVAFDFENTSITWDITLTAKYLRTATIVWDDDSRNSFKYWTIQIWDYVLMDRNLWAKKAWDGITWEDNSQNYGTDNDYYGYYYQWWNNWWFSDKTTSAWATTTITVSNEYIPSKYQNSNWNSASPWSEQTNLWWDDANTDEARQGPCPDWWHVPSNTEWQGIYDTWNSSTNKSTSEASISKNFAKDLKLSPAGYRNYGDLSFSNAGSNGGYCSSSPNGTNNAYYLGFNGGSVVLPDSYYRSSGFPVRCLMNSPVPQTYTLTFDATTNGWTDATTGNVELQEDETINLGNYTGTKDWYAFVWWNTNSWAHEKLSEDYDNYSISEDTTLYAIFKNESPLVWTFELNGALNQTNEEWTNVEQSVTRSCDLYNNETECLITAPVITAKDGFHVLWYNTSATATASILGQNTATDISNNTEWFAITESDSITFTGTFEKGQGIDEIWNISLSCSPAPVYNGAEINNSCSITAPSITTKQGYNNPKWNNTINPSGTITLTSNATFTATATPITYPITYVGADGLVTNSDYTVEDVVELPTVSKSGWIFDGWYDNSWFTWTPVESIPVWSTGNKTFYAKWTGKTFTVNFGANGAEINDNSETCTVTDWSTCNVSSLPTITRDWFTIKWWSTNQNATIADIGTNGSITLSEANDGATYYAITEKKVTVVFSWNGNWTYDDQICYIRNTASNCSVTAPSIIAPEGFDVIGWSTITGNHSDQWTSTPFTDDAVYYAQTKSSNPYTVTYYGNGNTLFWDVTEKVESCYRYNNEATCEVSVPSIQSNLPNTPTVVWYISHPWTWNVPAEIGWVELNSTAISNNNLKINISSDTNLYAVTYAVPKIYHVTYVKWDSWVVGIWDGEPSCLIPATYNGVAQALSCTITAPSISTNYDRTGNWWYDTNWKLIKYQDEIVIYADNTPVVAHSEGIYYVVSYVLDWWEFPEGVVDTWSYQKWTGFTLPIPVKDGYTFLNWKNAQTQEVVTAISDEDEWAKTFIATWRKDSFKITYDNVGYDLTSLPKSYAYGSETSVPDLPDSARRWYVFAWWTWEWQNEPTTGVVISAAQEWDIEFVAHWNVREYTITYNTKNWVVTPANPTTYTVESDDIHLVNPTRANSVFEGWMLEPVTVAVNDVYIYNGSIGDRTYTAKFSCEDGYQLNNDGTSCDLIEYDVTYKLNGGDNNENNPEKVSKKGSTYTITVYNPVKTGFTFEGWTTNIADYTCTTNVGQELEVCKSNNSTTPIKVVFNKWQNVKLTANWEHVKIDVTTANYFTNNQTTQNLTTKEYNYWGIINIYTWDIVWYQTTGWSTIAGWEIVFRNWESKLVSELESYITYSDSNANWRVSLYAVRKPITYTIVYDVDGWVNDSANPSERLITDVSFELKAPVKTGYDFVAWKTNKWVVVEDITKELLGSLEAPYTLYLKAFYEPRTDTKYTVYHVKQWIDGSYNTGAETTEIFTGEGTTDSPVTPEVRTYVGFTSPQQTTKDIAPDGKMHIIYNYVRAKNNYTYNTAVWATTKWKTPLVGWSSEETTEEIFYETPIILTWEANIGYTWSGWDVTTGWVTTRINNQTYTFDMPLDDVVVTPVVDHNKWTLRFDVNGGTWDADALAESYPVYYDDAISYPVVTRMWYTFLGWYDEYDHRYDEENLRMPDANLVLTAHWQANDFTLNINHYRMNLSWEYSDDLKVTETIETKIDADLTWTIDTKLNKKTYTGFTLSWDEVQTIHINPDGSSVINYYYSRDKHNVTVNENEGVTLSWTKSWEYYYGSTINVEGKVKEWYTWSGWNVSTGTDEPIFTTDTGVIKVLWTWDLVFTPLTTINSYHLTVKNDGAIIFSWDVVYKTNIAQYLAQPTKNGYTFNGWSNRPTNDLMPAKDLVIEAKWTYKSNWWGGGWWGWGGSSSSDTKKVFYSTTWAQEKTHGSAELTGADTKVKDSVEEKVTTGNEKSVKDMGFEELKNVNADRLKNVDRTKLTKEENEILDAYQWAYEHNVTTMVTLRDANPEGVVTRWHLAKMVVNYATNVLGQQIPEKIPSECRWSDGKKDWESDEIKDYAVKACALGLMWLDMKKFSPNLRVTRAQFGTIMSRLLWWKKYAWGTPYYRKHLNALKLHNIMTQIQNPEGRVELRQWVWLMLMRAGEEK